MITIIIVSIDLILNQLGGNLNIFPKKTLFQKLRQKYCYIFGTIFFVFFPIFIISLTLFLMGRETSQSKKV